MTDKKLLDRIHEELRDERLAERHLVTLERLMNRDMDVQQPEAVYAFAWALLQMVEG